jgi:hypothetical protein
VRIEELTAPVLLGEREPTTTASYVDKGAELAARCSRAMLGPSRVVDLPVNDADGAYRALVVSRFVELGGGCPASDIHQLRPLVQPDTSASG